MNKPSTIIYEEFKQNLASLINNCGLPAFVIEPILKDYSNEVKVLAQKQYQLDLAEYKDSLEKQKEE